MRSYISYQRHLHPNSRRKEEFVSRSREFLIRNGIINDLFSFEDIEPEKLKVYAYFENRFRSLFKSYGSAFKLGNYFFYLKDDNCCNARALKARGWNIISITNGYPILMAQKFDDKFFDKLLLVGLINEGHVSDAYCELHEEQHFKFNHFMLECSLMFTFGHEFRHILQFHHCKTKNYHSYSESLDTTGFDIHRHVWEYDADRSASYQVLKFIFQEFRKLDNRSDDKLGCMMNLGLASILITKSLFYFGLANQIYPDHLVKKPFYTERFSHPHPLVRMMNIFSTFHDNAKEDFPNLDIDTQQLLNNCLGIMKIYFDNLIPGFTIMEDYFYDMKEFLDDVHAYNNKLYDLAIRDHSIASLLKSQGVSFELVDH
jgi:hypothetical protein